MNTVKAEAALACNFNMTSPEQNQPEVLVGKRSLSLFRSHVIARQRLRIIKHSRPWTTLDLAHEMTPESAPSVGQGSQMCF